MDDITKSVGPSGDFEAAIKATGFGKFNILLLLTIIPPAFAQVFETAELSYVFPVAQCDLGLTLEDKGLLNAITFAGMISSGFLWGYLCDSVGRRKIMILGYFLAGTLSLIVSASQNVTMLITAKFLGGFVINGPFSATISYLSEFHATQYRARIQLVRGILITSAIMILPLLAWGILPRNLNFTFGYFDIHAWNIFLLICALAPIAAGVLFIFMPESPKFLMSNGRNEEALEIFRKVYRINSGQPVETYPIKQLIDENIEHRSSSKAKDLRKPVKESIKTVLLQIKPLFCPPNISKLILVCLNGCIMMISLSSLQLWLPQLFQSVGDYKLSHNDSNPTVCEMLQELSDSSSSSETPCLVNLDNSSVYINSTILGTAQILAFIFAGFFVNILGKKKLMFIVAFVSGCSAISIYFAQSSDTLIVFSAIFLSFACVSGNVLVTATLELFPTTLRAMALSMHSMWTRVGALIGNLIFPVLLYTGCATPFIFTGTFALGCALLSLLYPNTDNKALK